jgi:flagellar motility protein MotE (MotC chaperone)
MTRPVLPLIAGMLILSATLRFGVGANAAVAEAVAPEASPDPAFCTPGASTAEVLAAFQARESRLQDRELALADRTQAINLAAAEVAEQIAALEAAEQSLAAMISQADGAAEDDLNQLTLVYENMKPADAAALFETMSADFAAGFLGRMTPQAAAAVMADLAPETAYAISAILAGRNAGAPTE